MGLIDFIGNANEEQLTVEKQTDQEQRPVAPAKASKNKPDIHTHPMLVPTAKSRTKPKTEKLKFLKPCPICQGREFTHGKNGGFFCNSCQPGIDGQPVTALGHRKPLEAGNSLPGVAQQPRGTKPAQSNRPAGPEQQYFQAAFPWIREHLPELLAAGWTRPELFRRGHRTWPAGNWGIAWVSAWSKKNLVVSIGHRGKLIFRFTSGGRNIKQTVINSKQVKF